MSSDSLLLSNLKGIVNSLSDTIFEPDQRRVLSLLDAIVERNAILHNDGDIAKRTIFTFGGGMYNHTSNKGRGVGTKKLPLHEELIPRMEKYQKEFAQLTQDYTRVKQFLAAQVAGLKSEQDLRNSIPDSALPLTNIKSLMSLQRTVPIEQTHKHKPGTLAELRFGKTLEIIDAYVAMRYIL